MSGLIVNGILLTNITNFVFSFNKDAKAFIREREKLLYNLRKNKISTTLKN